MMMGDHNFGGSTEGPASPDNYKRAVFRATPSRFTVEMLPPAKHGGDFSYGMMVHPIKTDTASVVSSRTNNRSYEIWRRWSDCLMFQETLEMEYRRMARSKKQRLVAGKGVKKNGIYIHDMAASFESLPPGPDPNSIHLNIHDHLPKLTKKGTLFRTSPAMAEQRNKELRALIESLFSPGAPMLLIELRGDRVVTDFFGFWRRDYDLARKLKPETEIKPRSSVSSSIFSSYFSPSIIDDVPATPPSPSSRSLRSSSTRSRRPGTASSTTSQRSPPSPVSTCDSFRRPPRRDIHTSSSSSDGGSSRDSKGSDQLGSVAPIVFTYNPEHDEGYAASEKPVRTPEVETGTKTEPNDVFLVPSVRRANRPPALEPRAGNRKGQIFITPPILPASPTEDSNTQDEISVFESDHSNRASWATGMSVTDYLEQLGLPLSSPDTEYSFRDSVATFRTDCSADAVLGRHRMSQSHAHHRRSLSAGPQRCTVSICEEGTGYGPDGNDDEFDLYLSDTTSCSERPDTASTTSSRPASVRLSHFFRPRASSFNSISTYASGSTSSTSTGIRSIATFATAKDDVRSIAGTVSSTTTSLASEGTLAIKAAYSDSIVMLRVPKTITFGDMRRRLLDKFVRQEKIPLRESFTVAQVIPSSPLKSAFAQLQGSRASKAPQMCVIASENDWEEVVSRISTSVEKLNFHLLD